MPGAVRCASCPRGDHRGVFFDGWGEVARVLVMGVCAYLALILLLRLTGKRTLSKMNAFDLVVTVAIGSTLATILLSREVSLAEGVTALGLLVFLQYAIAWLSVRSSLVDRLVKAQPRLLFYRGEFLHQALLAERVNEDEVLAAVREQGCPSLDHVEAVILETSGIFSVLRRGADADPSALLQPVGGATHTG